ncbi:MAG: hypothetical protein NTW86_28070, partial [Candidatus Sumerlaeota bacterium]|nr:hypothetical protein [Candidatus Sumerlaeota bacterium]
ADDLRACGLGDRAPAAGEVWLPPGGVDLEEIEKQYVVAALRRANWRQKEAARLLNISVDRMNARVKKFGLRHPSWRTNK